MSFAIDQLAGLPVAVWAGLVVAAVFSVHLIPLITDPYNVRCYPGPFLAKISDVWLGWVAAQGHRSEVVHELHQKYGTSFPCDMAIGMRPFRHFCWLLASSVFLFLFETAFGCGE